MSPIQQVFIALIVALIGGYIAVYHFLGQKWWGKKDTGYTELIDALRDAMQYSESMGTAHATQGHTIIDTGVTKERNRQSIRTIKRLIATGPYVVNDETIAILKSLRFAADSDDRETPEEVLFDADFHAFKNALTRIRRIAEQELGKSGAYVLT